MKDIFLKAETTNKSQESVKRRSEQFSYTHATSLKYIFFFYCLEFLFFLWHWHISVIWHLCWVCTCPSNSRQLDWSHSVWKSQKMSHFPFFNFSIFRGKIGNIYFLYLQNCLKIAKSSQLDISILAFSTNFCPIRIDLSGNTT